MELVSKKSCVSCCCAMPTSLKSIDVNQSSPSHIPLIVRICILYRAIALPGSFFVFVLYWGLVFDGTLYPVSIFTHGVNFIIMAFDTLLSRQTLPLSHWVYFELYAVGYCLWSIIFHIAGLDKPCDCSEDDDEQSKWGCEEKGTKNNADECRYIYGALSWVAAARTSTTILVIILAFVAAPVFYLIFYFVVLAIRHMAVGGDNNGDNNVRGRQETIDYIEKNGFRTLCCYEMKWSRLSLTDENWVDNFRQSSFKSIPDIIYICIRIFWFLFILAIMFWSVGANEIEEYYLIYVTHWTLISEVIYLFTALISTCLAQKIKMTTVVPKEDDNL